MSVGTGYNLSFPTPESLPDDTVCRIFTLPADPIFLGAFMGALEYLTDPEHWQEVGSVSPEDSAQAMFDAIDASYALAEDGVCSAVVPAPYWDEDSGDDADDEAPADDQAWYGEIVNEGVTWREQVGIWAITAFVAVAATPAAAIAFLPFANRFVLAFKQNSLGAIVKVLIDGIEMATVDTYAPADAVQNITISLPAPAAFRAFDADPPVLWVMHTGTANPAVTGTPTMSVIRKRLDTTEVTPANLRWNSDCDCVQQTPDKGETWTDSPTQDPRYSTIFQVPARAGSDPRCDAAQQMHDRIKNMLDAVIASSDILQAINSVVALIAVFMFEFGIIIEAIWAFVSAIFSVGTTTLNAALTDSVYDELLCILYCEIESDGTVTMDDFDTIYARVNAEIGGVAAIAITNVLLSVGSVGLTNAGALGEVTGDCSACDCGWCLEFDFRTGLHGWTLVSVPGLDEGHQVDGVGIVANVQNDACTGHGYINMYIDLGATIDNIDTVEIVQTSPNFDIGGTYFVDQDMGATIVTRHGWGSFSGSGTVAVGINDGTSYDRIGIVDFQCGQDAGNPQTIPIIRFKGFGIAPSVGDVCP